MQISAAERAIKDWVSTISAGSLFPTWPWGLAKQLLPPSLSPAICTTTPCQFSHTIWPYFPGINTSVDNAIFYGDGRLSLPRMTLYGELLVNEFPMAPTETNPKLYALTLGLESKALIAGWDLLLEVCRVSDQAYSNGRPENVFTYGEQSLGHVLGDDLTAADIRFSGNLPKLGADARFGLFFLRLGNTDVAPWIGEAEPVTPGNYRDQNGCWQTLQQASGVIDLERVMYSMTATSRIKRVTTQGCA